MTDLAENVNARFNTLKESIAALGRFTQFEDFQANTGKGFWRGLEVLYGEQLESLEQTLQAVADLISTRREAESSAESVTTHLDALREDLQSFWPTDEGSPCLFAKHIENAERAARAAMFVSRAEENEELRQQFRAQQEEIEALQEKNAELEHTLMTERRNEMERVAESERHGLFGDG